MPTKRVRSSVSKTRIHRLTPILLVPALILIVGCSDSGTDTTGAVTRTVILGGGGDFPDIQACIDASSNGDTCLVYPGTYAPIRFYGKAITVTSSGGTDVTILDGNDGDTVVRFVDGEGASSILNGFTIRNGNALTNGALTVSSVLADQGKSSPGEENGGGIKIWISSPVIRNCIIKQNHADGNGGGVYCAFTGSRPAFRHVIFQENTSEGMGGGMAVFSGLPDLEDCLFLGNRAETGGAVSGTFGANILLSNCTIADNAASSPAGADALYLANASADLASSILWGSYWIEDQEAFSGQVTVLDLEADTGGSTTLFLNRVDLQGRIEQGVVFTQICLANPDRCGLSIDPEPFLIPENTQDDPDPLFVPLLQAAQKQGAEDLRNAYFLSQIEGGQGVDSPCLDTGGESAVKAGLDERTTQNGQNGVQEPDTQAVDLGFHYPITFP